MENKTNRNQYVNIDKIEQLRKEKKYSIAFINNTILQYNGRNHFRRKCNSEIAFTIDDLVLLANLFNVRVEDLLIKGGRI
jgi:hypothetical protein